MRTLNKLKEITDGWLNVVFESKEIEALANNRAIICSNCPINNNNFCSRKKEGFVIKGFKYKDRERYAGQSVKGCGCPLISKLRSVDTQCPRNAWEK